MAGRKKTFDDDDALASALEIFWQKGYESTTTQDLLKAMNLNKGSLYNTFKSKKHLFIKVIDYYAVNYLGVLEQQLADTQTPLQDLEELFLGVCSNDPDSQRRGCFLGNSVTELANVNKELQSKVIARLRKVEEIYARYLDKARAMGQLSEGKDVQLLARYLINLWNGIHLTRRIHPDEKELERLIKQILTVLH